MNAIMTISPYKINSIWAFDDPAVGLIREPFVCGMGEIFDEIVKDIPSANQGVTLLFSDKEFPSTQGSLKLINPESGGNWYKHKQTDMIGWLCPALFKYFEKAPKEIFYQTLPKNEL